MHAVAALVVKEADHWRTLRSPGDPYMLTEDAACKRESESGDLCDTELSEKGRRELAGPQHA